MIYNSYTANEICVLYTYVPLTNKKQQQQKNTPEGFETNTHFSSMCYESLSSRTQNFQTKLQNVNFIARENLVLG